MDFFTRIWTKLQPLAVSLLVWWFNFRPITRLVDWLNSLLREPRTVPNDTLAAMDILFIGALLEMILECSKGIIVTGRMVNMPDASNYTTLKASDNPKPGSIRLSLEIRTRRRFVVTILRKLGHVHLLIRCPNNAASLDHSVKYKGDGVYLFRKGVWPAIRLTEQLEDCSERLPLNYTLQALANGSSRPEDTIRVVVEPSAEDRWRRFLTRVALALFVRVDINEHIVRITG